MKFWNWGPTAIWHNIESVALFSSKLLHPTVQCTYCISDSYSYYVIVIYGGKIKSVWIEMNISDFSPKNAYHCMSNAIKKILKCSKFNAFFLN